MAEHLPGFDLVMVGLFDRGDEHSIGGELQWLASVYATLWHEIAHVLYSEDFPWLDEPRLRYAANLLEDGRAERRLVEEHPELRPWLRRNVLLGRGQPAATARATSEDGWPHELIVVGTRHTAKVVDDADFRKFCAQLRREVPVQQLVDAWSSYIALADDELDAPVVRELATELVPHLLDHHRIEDI